MKQELKTALQGLSIAGSSLDLLEKHWRLVQQWNQRVNLTSIENDHEAAWLHYRDSLEALAFLPPGPLVDLGSGAGFPGLPIAVAEPHRPVTLIDSRRKRAAFLQTASSRLNLTNVEVLQARMQEPRQKYVVAVTRATFSSDVELEACLGWVISGGMLIAFRSEQSARVIHRYELLGQPRLLQAWKR